MSQEVFAFLSIIWAFIFGVGYILANRREKKFEKEMRKKYPDWDELRS